MTAVARERLGLEGSLAAFARASWEHFETAPLSDGPHLDAIARAVEAFARGELLRVVLNQPPGSMKTTFSSIFLPSWVWATHPERRFLYVCYGEAPLRTATEKLLKLLRSDWYRERWGEVVRETAGVSSFSTIQGGGRLNTTPKGRGVGLHFDYGIIDDAIKPTEADGGYAITGTVLEATWNNLQTSTLTRGKDPTTYGVMIQGQRVHEIDPPGRALAEGGWTHVCLPALFEVELASEYDWRTVEGEPLNPERLPPETIAKLQRNEVVWQTQYQQRPYVPGGSIVHEEWIRDHTIPRHEFDAIRGQAILSWDLTFKKTDGSDFVAGQWWKTWMIQGDQHYAFMPVFFERASFLETLQAIRKARRECPAGEILIEDKANGAAIEDVLSREWQGVIKLYNPGSDSKVARLNATQSDWSLGRVHLVRGDWEERIVTSFTRFPRVRRDDEIDAASQAIAYLRQGSYLLGLLGDRTGR